MKQTTCFAEKFDYKKQSIFFNDETIEIITNAVPGTWA